MALPPSLICFMRLARLMFPWLVRCTCASSSKMRFVFCVQYVDEILGREASTLFNFRKALPSLPELFGMMHVDRIQLFMPWRVIALAANI